MIQITSAALVSGKYTQMQGRLPSLRTEEVTWCVHGVTEVRPVSTTRYGLPMVVFHASRCTVAFATAKANFGGLVRSHPHIRALFGNVPSLLALVAQHCKFVMQQSVNLQMW